MPIHAPSVPYLMCTNILGISLGVFISARFTRPGFRPEFYVTDKRLRPKATWQVTTNRCVETLQRCDL